ncbi:MAG: helix-turn-helix domain-containing protein [Roseiflexaceae bacterium]
MKRSIAAAFVSLQTRRTGWPQKQIAAALGVTPGAVSQWLRTREVA